MGLRFVIFLIAAVAASAGVGLLVYDLVEDRKTAASPERTTVVERETYDRVEVLATSAELSVGAFIRSEDVRWISWPADAVSEGMVLRSEDEMETITGAVVRRDTGEGEPLMRRAFLRPEDGGFLAAVLEPGMRAISVNVNTASGNAGFVLPGDQVDLILTHRVENGENGDTHLVSETLQSGLRVLAVDQSLDNDRTAQPAKTMTIEVDRRQAEHIILAEQLGQLTVVLQSIANLPNSNTFIASESERAGQGAPAPQLLGDTASWDYEVSPALSESRSGAPRTVAVMRGSGSETITSRSKEEAQESAQQVE
ncbi:Flp pilus assembly protein CpaB [Fodinicurvata fenggangensis]|uniref:Flp pilus assembly protein CpaB n=1 Tax=Fodinicurvata fenggangensis TaxID=1121830 RepID=UPI0004797CD9|nr:Flp pilus assembly protein CpaB [Fodinicurvata fenggangensis]